MRRAASWIALITLVVAAVVQSGTAASAGPKPRVRHYAGSTSEGGRFAVTVMVSDGVVRLEELTVSGTLTCEDGTASDLTMGLGWGRGPRLTDQRLDVAETGFNIALMVNGRLGSHGGSGTLTLLFPGLTADEQAQLCSMGELTWTLERTAHRTTIAPGQAVRVQRVDGRRVTVAIAAGVARGSSLTTRSERRPDRHYRGRTSQNGSMRVTTRAEGTGIDLLRFSWGWALTCDDGTEVAGGSGYFFGGGGPSMPRGRLDLDLVTVGPGSEALHVHGELGAHAGDGTVAMVWPALTEDLQAQLCSSGEQTWDLWRTDAGF